MMFGLGDAEEEEGYVLIFFSSYYLFSVSSVYC